MAFAMMTISEDVRDVVTKLTVTLPPTYVAILVIQLVFTLGILWFAHDLSLERIKAVVQIFDACTKVMTK